MSSAPILRGPELFPAVSLPPAWMLCTPGAVSGALVPEGRRPFGVRHARGIGSLTTRCGTYAVSWVNFHTQAFDPGHPDACPRCRELSFDDR